MVNAQLLTFDLVSTSTTVTRVLVPEGTILPAAGIWRRKESGRKVTYILDTSQSRDSWLALTFTGRILWRLPEDGIEPVVFDANLFVGYAKPGTWLTLQFGNGVKAPVRILPHVPRV
jgi:hypothetical protein